MQHELILVFKPHKILVLSLFLTLTILSLACQKQNATTFENAKEFSQTKKIPKDWQKIETEDFSFSMPPTMKKNDVQGIDSFMIQFENDEITLNIEYGDYSADVASQLQSYEGQKEQTIIDGENVVIVNYDISKPILSKDRVITKDRMVNAATPEKLEKTKKKYFVGVNFPNKMKSFSNSAISFEVRCKNLESQEIAKTILNSIKFKQK